MWQTTTKLLGSITVCGNERNYAQLIRVLVPLIMVTIFFDSKQHSLVVSWLLFKETVNETKYLQSGMYLKLHASDNVIFVDKKWKRKFKQFHFSGLSTIALILWVFSRVANWS